VIIVQTAGKKEKNGERIRKAGLQTAKGIENCKRLREWVGWETRGSEKWTLGLSRDYWNLTKGEIERGE